MEVCKLRKAGNLRGARRAEAEGLTIVELLVALFIVMLAFAALASTVIASFTSIRNTEARVRGVALANELVEEMGSIPWRHLGFPEDDPPEDEAGNEIEEFEGETIVLLEVAGGEDDPFLKHTETIERDRREYQVERLVTQVEEDEDGNPTLIRMIAFVRWELGGNSFEIRSDGLRAPDAQDLFDLEVTVDVVADNKYDTAMWLREPGDSEPEHLMNTNPIVVSAEMGIVPASIELRFRDRDDNLITLVGADAVETGTTSREWTIGSNSYRFRHGRTAFTVVATGSGGESASNTDTLRFYQNLVLGDDPVVKQGGFIVTEIEVGDDNRLCDPVTVELVVAGMTLGEATPQPVDDGGEDEVEGGLTILWNQDPPDEPVAMGLVEASPAGGRFEAGVVHENEELVEFTSGTDVTFEILADRRSRHHVDFEQVRSDDLIVPVVTGC